MSGKVRSFWSRKQFRLEFKAWRLKCDTWEQLPVQKKIEKGYQVHFVSGKRLFASLRNPINYTIRFYYTGDLVLIKSCRQQVYFPTNVTKKNTQQNDDSLVASDKTNTENTKNISFWIDKQNNAVLLFCSLNCNEKVISFLRRLIALSSLSFVRT